MNKPPIYLINFCCFFFNTFKGGDQVDLVPGGASIEVTSSNVHDYVRKYAEYRMCKAPEKALEVREFGYVCAVP